MKRLIVIVLSVTILTSCSRELCPAYDNHKIHIFRPGKRIPV